LLGIAQRVLDGRDGGRRLCDDDRAGLPQLVTAAASRVGTLFSNSLNPPVVLTPAVS
jgi:hypothetical protein